MVSSLFNRLLILLGLPILAKTIQTVLQTDFTNLPTSITDDVTTQDPQENAELNDLIDKNYGQFLYNEFDYEDYLTSAQTGGVLVPFKDVSNDTFWRTGKIEFKQLRHYVEKNLTDDLDALETKPWLSVKKIKDELARCVHYRYGSVSEQEFIYDKEMYGWMNLMKFTCLKTGDLLYYGMGFGRFRFRLKEILLRKEKRSWGRSSRDITMRDMHKMVEHFSRQFAEKIRRKVNSDIRRMFPNNIEERKDVLRLINLPTEVVNEVYNLFPEDDIVEVPHHEKENTFSFVSLPITIRIAVLNVHEVQPIVDIYYGDLSEDSQTAIELCAKKFCTATDQITELAVEKNGHRAFFKDRSLRYDTDDREVLIAYASSRPEFQLAKRMKKKNDRLVELKQELDEEAMDLWYDLLDSQVAHNFYMQHANFFA